MQLKRFLGNLAKTYLVVGALSVSALAVADSYNSFDHGMPVDHGYPGDHFVGDQGYNYGGFAPGCSPSAAPQGCNTGLCCGIAPAEPPVCGWAYNPPAYLKCCGAQASCDGFFDKLGFRADFLWWRANLENSQLGYTEEIRAFTSPGTPSRTTVTDRSRARKLDFKYDPGFRIGILSNCDDCWDFAINWTHFHTKAHVSGFSDADLGIDFFSDWERIIGANPLTASAHYKLDLDLVDIEFGRKFYVSNCFILRPQFGLRVARIDQHYNVEGLGLGVSSQIPLTSFSSEVRSRSKFLSVGPRVGVDIELHVGCGLAVFGCASGSLLFGKFDNHAREKFTDLTSSSGLELGVFDYDAGSSSNRCSRAVTDYAIGVKWERCFEWCNRSHPISLAFAWEHHVFYDLNNFNFIPNGAIANGNGTVTPTNTGVRKHGNLYTQGLTVSLGLGF